MMGKQSGQIQMVILDIDSMIPEDHLLRRIKNCVNFDFIYEKAAPYYSHVGRKSIDLHIAKLNGRLCGAKRPHSVSEQPNFYQSLQSNPYNDSSHPSGW